MVGTLAQHRLVAVVGRISARLGDADATVLVPRLGDTDVLAGLAEVAEARKALDVLTAVFTSEVDVRSARELGYTGLAQRTGHRTGTDLVQHVTGQKRTDVIKATRTGRDLTAAMPIPPVIDDQTGEAGPVRVPWFAPLTDALSAGTLSQEQFDAIRRGLGDPPVDRYPNLDPGFLPAAWRRAAVTLIGEAADRGVEELAAAARLARDTLDPVGVTVRFEQRFAKRSFRCWVDESGQRHGHFVFDDDAAAWVTTILNAALRPRRGPRFVDPTVRTEVEAAAAADDRSAEQLQYDTIMAVLRTGAAADPTQAFGDRQPGVRVITTSDTPTVGAPADAAGSNCNADADTSTDTDTARAGAGGDHDHSHRVAYYEETGQALPEFVLKTYLCDAGTVEVNVDAFGSPLDVGREKRLFTKRQRIAIAVRDGGCLWCGAEPSRCEAHHIDHWVEHRGRTDTRDGVYLCRNCHMRLHNQHRRVTRQGRDYWLHAPPGPDGRPTEPPRQLQPRSLLRFRTPPAA